MTYAVFCYRFDHPSSKVEGGLSLVEAKSICKNPQTSSATSTDITLMKRWGPGRWFYGYSEE